MSTDLPEKSPIYCFDCGKRLFYERKDYTLSSVNFLYSCKDIHSEVRLNKNNEIIAYSFYWIDNLNKYHIESYSELNYTEIKSKVNKDWKVMVSVKFYIPIELENNKLKVDNIINQSGKLLKVRAFT